MPESSFSFFVQWHLTERCNLRCRHCYQGAVPDEMSYEEVCLAIDDIKNTIEGWREEYAMEIPPSFHFTGGEPFLRRDLFSILSYASSLGFELSILSNGTLITDAMAARIKKAGVTDVQVSMEGLKKVHDAIRGDGSYERTLRGIKYLVANGVDTNINITLSHVNADQIEGLLDLAEEVGFNAVTFSRLVPCGRGKGLAGEMLNANELAVLYTHARKLGKERKVQLSSRDPLFTLAEISGDVPQIDFPVGGCAAGMFGVTVTSDGGVMPCRRMNMVVGNIRKQSLREIWAKSPVMWKLRQRSEYHGGCETCYYWPVCRGCRAIAIAASSSGRKDYLGPDPQCPYRKPIQSD